MAIIFYMSVILVLALAKAEEGPGSKNKAEEESIAYDESIGSPVYGGSSGLPYPILPLNGKSGYNYPVPAAAAASLLSSLPASYAPYYTSLGLNNPYNYGAYNRYNNYLPYSVPSTYGSPLQNTLGYGSALVPGLGYTGYGSPYYGRSTYPGDGYPYPGYAAGLGYRYSNMGYAPAALRAGPVARPVAPVAGVPPRMGVFPAPVSSVSAPFAAVPPYGPAVRSPQSKVGPLRYAYAPDAQILPAY